MPRAKHPPKTNQAAAVFIKSLIFQTLKFIFYLYNFEYCFYVVSPCDKADERQTVCKQEIAVTGHKNMWIPLDTLEMAALCLGNTVS